jgi:hypothetical protein
MQAKAEQPAAQAEQTSRTKPGGREVKCLTELRTNTHTYRNNTDMENLLLYFPARIPVAA